MDPVVCAACRTPVEAGVSVCPGCGAPVPAPEGQPVPPAFAAAGFYGPAPYGPGAYGPPPSAAGQVAGVGLRVGGWLLDFVFFFVFSSVLAAMLAVFNGSAGEPAYYGLWNVREFLFGLVFFTGYYVVPTALSGQTLAKMILGTRVVDARTGAGPGWSGAGGRYAVMYLLNLPCWIPTLINAILMGNDPRNRGWHDRAANTVVIRTR